jgi:hypothetical protein
VTFEILLSKLREVLREKVKNGQLTERGLARLTGVSQPHLHNILKGIRSLPPELADQLVTLAGLDLPHLMEASRSPTGQAGILGKAPGNSREMEILGDGREFNPANYLAFQLPVDSEMEPRFRGGDIVYYQRNPEARMDLNAQAVYLVNHNGSVVARYLRFGGHRLYLVSEGTLHDPIRWDYVSLAGRHILEVVRGRIVWICRKVETTEAGTSEETRGDDRRVG